ncbi:hypothetical protein Cgig2_024517 [Carnegiea gigantea]|uniref:Uncharacterized protein n=1 Tax=Carnegiea gigantea TaxID=171969 RepID=A0A9Q1GLM7_9CARY|nr:hypothetical protein Cgig2_024517 [Carnegiea gigantea]
MGFSLLCLKDNDVHELKYYIVRDYMENYALLELSLFEQPLRKNFYGMVMPEVVALPLNYKEVFALTSPFGQSNVTNNPFAPKPFGTPNPFGSQTGSSIFGNTSTGVFGQSSSPLSSTPVFGASSSPGFGGSTPAFGSSSSSFGEKIASECRD